MFVDVLLGLQWGDEGKGKIVDYLADQYDIVARFQGGPNAGHTLKIDGESFVLHTIPSGIFHEGTINLIGNGVVIDPATLKKELEKLQRVGVDPTGKLLISNRAHLILPTHKMLDAASEARKGKAKIGSTLRGIGPTYMDETGRNGLRVGDILTGDFDKKYNALKNKHLDLLRFYDYEFDLSEVEAEWMEGIEVLRAQKIISAEYFLSEHLKNGSKILAEGAQGSLLDINFGTYPYVTSSNTISSSACIGLGIPPQRIREVIGISKAYCTRVGSGPFPTELEGATGELLRKEGSEFGATTGRPRRCGWIDLPALKYVSTLNGLTQLVITKIDVLNNFSTISAATAYKVNGRLTDELPLYLDGVEPVYQDFEGWQAPLTRLSNYEELPEQALKYLDFVEEYLDTRIGIVSTGPGREELILKTAGTPA